MKNTIAVIFDFDDTLAPDSTTGYLREHNVNTSAFWKTEVAPLTDSDWDPVPAYLYKMIRFARDGKIPPITRDSLAGWGQRLPLHKGVDTLFQRLRHSIRDSHPTVAVEFYLISSGIGDVLRHTAIAKEFTDIWASEFHYDEHGHAAFIKKLVSFTDKTRYLFHIQKGLIGTAFRGKPLEVNRKFSTDQLRIPMNQFVFVGDGMTDIPCFSLVGKEGGMAIGVYDEAQPEKWGGAFRFVTDKRVSGLYPADFSEHTGLTNFLMMAVKNLAEQITLSARAFQL